MADQLQLRGGTTVEHSTFTGALREVTVDIDKDTVVVHDNTTAGGHPLAKEDLSNVSGTDAASKLADQTVAFNLGAAATPSVTFNGDTNTGIYSPGADQLALSTNGTGRLFVDANGRVLVGTSSTSNDCKLRLSRGDQAGNYIDFGPTTRNANGLNRLLIYRHGYWSNSVQEVASIGVVTSSVTAGSGQGYGNLVFYTGGSGDGDTGSTSTERMRIDSSGRLLVGTASAPTQGVYAQYAPLVVRGYVGQASGNGIINISAGSAASALTSGADIGTLVFSDNAGGEFARVSCFTDAASGANDYPGRLVFSTTADGASSPTQRMLIKSTGLTELTSSAGNNGFGLFHIYNSTVRSGTEKDSMMRVTRTGALGISYDCVAALSMGRYSTAGANGYTELILQMNNGATTALDSTPLKIRASGEVRFVSAPTTASAANAFLDSANENRLLRSTSSLRYKTDIENIEHQRADAILNFRPVWYRSIAGSDRSDWSWYGLIAEEVAAIEPRLVHWTYLDDAYNITYETVENEDGTTVEVEKDRTLKPDAEQVPDGVQYDRLTVLLLDVVKRQQQTIADLEARVAALESA